MSTNPALEFSETKELGRLNRVDPLKITNMRIRGMWLIQPPIKVFDYLFDYDSTLKFQVFLLIPEDKYLSFEAKSLHEIENLVQIGTLDKKLVKVKDPNNPVHLVSAVCIALRVV